MATPEVTPSQATQRDESEPQTRDLEKGDPQNNMPQTTNVSTAADSTNSESSEVATQRDEKEASSTTQPASKENPDEVFWDSPDDPANPMNWSRKLKIFNVGLISTWTFLTPLASSMVAPGTLNILTDFHSRNATLGSFIVSIYIAGYAVGPLAIAPISELYGRIITYHSMNIVFIIFTLACAFAPNLGSLLAFRFFQGMAGVTPLTIGSGTIADMIPNEQRGKYMSLYSIGPLLGPVSIHARTSMINILTIF